MKIENLIKKFIKLDAIHEASNNEKDFYKFLKTYAELRLKLLNNKTVTKIEHKVIIAAIKAGIKYANSYYGLGMSNIDIDKAVDEYAPEVLKALRNLRIDVFEKVLFQGKEVEI